MDPSPLGTGQLVMSLGAVLVTVELFAWARRTAIRRQWPLLYPNNPVKWLALIILGLPIDALRLVAFVGRTWLVWSWRPRWHHARYRWDARWARRQAARARRIAETSPNTSAVLVAGAVQAGAGSPAPHPGTPTGAPAAEPAPALFVAPWGVAENGTPLYAQADQ